MQAEKAKDETAREESRERMLTVTRLPARTGLGCAGVLSLETVKTMPQMSRVARAAPLSQAAEALCFGRVSSRRCSPMSALRRGLLSCRSIPRRSCCCLDRCCRRERVPQMSRAARAAHLSRATGALRVGSGSSRRLFRGWWRRPRRRPRWRWVPHWGCCPGCRMSTV